MPLEPQELLEQYRQRNSHHRPILILAPVQRCGSTLLQRAINAGNEAIIFGENFIFMEKFPQLIGGTLHDFVLKQNTTQNVAKELQAGNRGIDATALFPDYARYARLQMDFFSQLLDFYSNEAETYSVKHWGIKSQIVDRKGMHNCISMIPNARIVVIYRDLIKAARSYRARWPHLLRSERQFADFGKRWQENMRFLLNIGRPKLIIRYEELTKNLNQHLPLIEQHLEIRISREIFNSRINVHHGDKQHGMRNDISQSEHGLYVPPAPLNTVQQSALLTHAREVYEQLEYQAPPVTAPKTISASPTQQ
ncbi:MAG: sulfotransferase [Rickettsiales bacterium]|nr:sulfotransferase [Rickettsiales bacterium]